MAYKQKKSLQLAQKNWRTSSMMGGEDKKNFPKDMSQIDIDDHIFSGRAQVFCVDLYAIITKQW